MSIMAFAAIAMTMTSCNKEQSAPENLSIPLEQNEVMNQAKTHFVGDDQYWDEGDQVCIMDSYENSAWYRATTTDGTNLELVFVRNNRGNFSVNNGTLTAVYPNSILVYPTEVKLPARQFTNAGEINGFPLYARGSFEDFQFRNICGLITFRITGDVALDSISITTDQYINGNFKVNIANLSNPLTYQSQSFSALAHGTKTNTLVFNNRFQTSSISREASIYLPAKTYKSFTITFYANGQKYTKRNRNNITITRSAYNTATINLNSADFEDYTNGATNAQYNVAADGETPQYVIFAQGNLEYIARGYQYWHFADNQWDFRGVYQSYDSRDNFDRDLISWGANGYYDGAGILRGNSIKVWGSRNVYSYYTGTTLSGNNEWGNNKIANGGNRANSGWRTLTQTEMENLLNNYDHEMVTLDFVNKTGLVIFPETEDPVSGSISKERWNALEAAGCVFFLADNYRLANGSMNNTCSYFWLNTADATTAAALRIPITDEEPTVTINKNLGAFIRLVKDVE